MRAVIAGVSIVYSLFWLIVMSVVLIHAFGFVVQGKPITFTYDGVAHSVQWIK